MFLGAIPAGTQAALRTKLGDVQTFFHERFGTETSRLHPLHRRRRPVGGGHIPPYAGLGTHLSRLLAGGGRDRPLRGRGLRYRARVVGPDRRAPLRRGRAAVGTLGVAAARVGGSGAPGARVVADWGAAVRGLRVSRSDGDGDAPGGSQQAANLGRPDGSIRFPARSHSWTRPPGPSASSPPTGWRSGPGSPPCSSTNRLLPSSDDWRDAFEGAFGITIDDFYAAFAGVPR